MPVDDQRNTRTLCARYTIQRFLGASPSYVVFLDGRLINYRGPCR
ncbi:hypothetical protein [Thiocapsa rosea]|uniref:Uncharacterized protein n=1 Tax=Thiocapsa rosea TaxID=69360 RepID=A0A495VC97_9GAMM|nr:hypothetical protein [Thiocapsa rosea]RKT47031.1 hypothetical protein BDD21_4580 [Thiocapsa rosea]